MTAEQTRLAALEERINDMQAKRRAAVSAIADAALDGDLTDPALLQLHAAAQVAEGWLARLTKERDKLAGQVADEQRRVSERRHAEMQRLHEEQRRADVARAAKWLAKRLADGPVLEKDIQREAAEMGLQFVLADAGVEIEVGRAREYIGGRIRNGSPIYLYLTSSWLPGNYGRLSAAAA